MRLKECLQSSTIEEEEFRVNVVCAQCVAVGERKILTFGNGRASQICQCLRGEQRFKYV